MVARLLRLALFETYDDTCQWCRKPLIFSQMEVDHLIPQSCNDEEVAMLATMHGRPADFDVQATYNLIPSCGPDNRHKSDRHPPDAPIISLMLDKAAELAPKIERRAQRHSARNRLDKHVAMLLEHPDTASLDEARKQAIADAIGAVRLASTFSTGLPPSPARIHPIGGLHDFVPPSVIDITDAENFGAGDMYAVVERWADTDYDEAKELVAAAFDHDDGKLLSFGLRDVTELGYSDEIGAYLARLDLSVEYMFYPPDDVAAPADDRIVLDVWFELDDERGSVVSAFADMWTAFG